MKAFKIICSIVFMVGLLSGFSFAEGEWETSGTDIINTNTGNVGIGTAAPEQKLDVSGFIRATDGYSDIITSAIAGAPFFDMIVDSYDNDSNNYSWAIAQIPVDDWLGNEGWQNHSFMLLELPPEDAMYPRITVLEGGNVGIGTTNPESKLEVEGQVTVSSLLIKEPNPPAWENAPGTPGQIEYDEDYVYVCIAPDTWKRARLLGWDEDVATVDANGNVNTDTKVMFSDGAELIENVFGMSLKTATNACLKMDTSITGGACQ